MALLRHRPASTADVADDVLAEFSANVVDQNVDGIALDFVAPAIQSFRELRPRQDRTRARHQSRQKRELTARQNMRYVAMTDGTGGEVERNRRRSQLRARVSRMAPHHGTNTRREFVEIERLVDEIVGTEVQPRQLSRTLNRSGGWFPQGVRGSALISSEFCIARLVAPLSVPPRPLSGR